MQIKFYIFHIFIGITRGLGKTRKGTLQDFHVINIFNMPTSTKYIWHYHIYFVEYWNMGSEATSGMLLSSSELLINILNQMTFTL